MRRAFADGGGPCRISSWPRHEIRPAQPNSRQSHFLYLRLRSSQRVWSFPRALRPRRWTSYWHSSTSSTRPSPSSAAQEWSFSSFSPSQPQKPYTTPGIFSSDPRVLKAMPNKLRYAHAKNHSKRTALCRFWGDVGGDAHARRL